MLMWLRTTGLYNAVNNLTNGILTGVQVPRQDVFQRERIITRYQTAVSSENP